MVKNLQYRKPGFDPCVEKIPWRKKGQPTPVLLPGKSHGQSSLAAYSPWGCQRVRHDQVMSTHGAILTLTPQRVAQRVRCMPRAICLLSGTSRIQAKLPISTPICAACTNSHHACLGSMVLHQPTWASMHSDLRLALVAPFMSMRVPPSCMIYPSRGAEGTHFELSPRVEQTETD